MKKLPITYVKTTDYNKDNNKEDKHKYIHIYIHSVLRKIHDFSLYKSGVLWYNDKCKNLCL